MDSCELTQDPSFKTLLRIALEEDIGPGDATSESLLPADAQLEATLTTREPCILSGTHVAAAVFEAVDARIRVKLLLEDGQAASPDQPLLTIQGPAQGILAAERTALNFMQRMCGIATVTHRYVSAVAGSGAIILDTRKTIPGYRILDKYAVRCGGGQNHRMGLYDRVMIKDNHRYYLNTDGSGSLSDAVLQARARAPGIPVEVEVETEHDFRDALSASPEWILLDNMAPDAMTDLVAIRGDASTRLEASGGITMDTIRAVADSGVDAISLGCLTHSVMAIDLSLETGLMEIADGS